MIACGALGAHLREIIARRQWPVELHTLPACCTTARSRSRPGPNGWRPRRSPAGSAWRSAYADCGTYGALDDVCTRLGLRRLPGLHCYDVFAGPDRVRELFDAEPGTYLLTDFLVRSFDRTVLAGLGPGPVPGTVAGLLRSLPPGGLARPGPDRGTPGRSGAHRGHVRPAAHRRRDRAHPAGTRARAAGGRAARRVTRGYPGGPSASAASRSSEARSRSAVVARARVKRSRSVSWVQS